MRVAIVHDWLVTFAGAEQVLAQILPLFPEADIFTVVDFLPLQDRSFLAGRKITTSFVQRFPAACTHYRSYLPLMPRAVERLDLSGYDLVISSSHAVAKGVKTAPKQCHICYCHSPMRYAWDMREEYLREAGMDRGLRGHVARFLLERLRRWDLANSAGVHAFLANSAFIAERIKRSYDREAVVVYPPVDTDYFTPYGEKSDYYLAASRMVPYKRMKLIVQAFSRMPQHRLVVIGDGPQYADALAAAGPNIRFLGYQPKPVLRDSLRQARALVFAAKEDFGILPVEAQACGTPVIAYGEGGALETVRGWGVNGEVRPTGLFFHQQTEEAIIAAVAEFEQRRQDFLPEYCRANALAFSLQRFRQEFVQAVFQSRAGS